MIRKGSEIVALAMRNMAVDVVTYVPGHGATELFDAYCAINNQKLIVSFNEEVAYTISHGAALTGKRACTVFKIHGFIKAGNSVSDSLYAGTTAGFVSIVVGDRKGASSDSIVEPTAYLKGVGIPYRVANMANLYEEVCKCFELSEKYMLPYALTIDASDLDSSTSSMIPEVQKPKNGNGVIQRYERNITQHLLCPLFGEYQHRVLNLKKAGRDWKNLRKPSLGVIPEALPDKWRPIINRYACLFKVFKAFRGKIVTGETGVSSFFAFPNYNCIDITTYMGGSVPLAIGAFMAGYKPAWAITGDFSFIAAGHMGLLEAVQRKIPLKVLILDNGKAETTGGQVIPKRTLERVLSGYSAYVKYIHNPQDNQETEKVLNEAATAADMRIVVANFRSGSEDTA